ncbi:MAG: lipopolysaccharide biosynthesis protein [Clostridia bacterium]|nr:lipopolysaccharide biosynthesis protein [Clostridia bacterium]
MEKEKPTVSTSKKVFLWNAAGSFTNAMSSVFLLMVVTRVLGPVEGGIFSIAFALAQQLLTVSTFETPTFFVTDTENKISFNVHLAAKIILYVLSIVAAAVIAIVKYEPYKAAVVVLVCAFKGADSLSGLIGGLLQKNEQLHIAGRSLAVRVAAAFGIFTVSLLLFENLILSSALSLVFSFGWIALYDGHFARKITALKPKWDFMLMLKLLLGCLPMFLGTFMLNYIINQPKFVIDNILDEVSQNRFGIIFMPSAVISLLGMFIYRPLLTTLTKVWKDRDFGQFLGKIFKISAIIITLTILCTVCAWFLGVPVLSAVYGVDLAGLEANLCLIILGGGMYAIANLIYNGIVIMRHQYSMIIAYVLAYGVSLAITAPLVKSLNLMGASVSYVISTGILATLMLGVFLFYVFREKKRSLEGNK